jgi:putative polyhydroxyalkanoate system protein
MAKHIEMSQPHQLSTSEARGRMTRLLAQLEEKYGLSTSWSSEKEARVEGKGVQGSAVLSDDSVSVSAQLTLPASLIAGKIEQALRDALQKEFG